MLDCAHFAVHQRIGAHDLAAKCLPNGLVAKADPDQRRAGFGGGCGQRKANASLRRVTRAGGEHDGRGLQRHRLLHIQRVVAAHLDLRAQFRKVVDQIPCEAVIIINQQQHLALINRRY